MDNFRLRKFNVRGAIKTINVGDRIQFKAICMYGAEKATRKVVGFYANGFPCVRYAGWSRFVVNPNEIIEVIN